MEIMEKIFLAMLVLLAAAAIILLLMKPAPPQKGPAAETLFFQMQAFGENLTGYSYVYNETSNNFPLLYWLCRSGGDRMVKIESPLSTKKIYYMQNSTVMCIRYLANESCAHVGNESTLNGYLLSVGERFFDNSRIAGQVSKMREGMRKKYVVVNPTVIQAQYNGRKCLLGRYTFDYTGISMQDMPRYGVYPGTPVYFEGSYCIDNATGTVYWAYFNYTHNGMLYEWKREYVSLDNRSDTPIIAPDVSERPGTLAELAAEQDSYEKLANCYLQADGEERHRCISMLALAIKSPALCSYAAERKDRCIVSLVPLLLDETLCSVVSDLNYRDDCYIELAGGLKRPSYCSMLLNASKHGLCNNVSSSSG